MADDVRIVHSTPVGTGLRPRPKTYRRPPSQAEQERRREWGKKWGALVSEATKGIREGRV